MGQIQQPSTNLCGLYLFKRFPKIKQVFCDIWILYEIHVSVLVLKVLWKAAMLIHLSCPWLPLQCDRAMLCHRPSGQQCLNTYYLSFTEKFLDPCCGWYFLQTRFTYASGRWQGYSKPEIAVIQFKDWDGLKAGISNRKVRTISSSLVVLQCYLLGSHSTTREAFQGSLPFCGRPWSPDFVPFSRGFQTLFPFQP